MNNDIEELLKMEKEHAEKILSHFFNVIIITFLLSLIFLFLVIIFRLWG